MQTAIHSKMIIHETYDYKCGAVEVCWFWPVKARKGEVILVNTVSIYNNSGANYGACYKAIKHQGIIHRVNYTAAINNGVVHRWSCNNYITDGDEAGVGITPNQAAETVQIAIQGIRFTDADYNKLFGL